MADLVQVQVPDSIIQKIKKLLALSDKARGSTEHEAALALSRAQELLAKYNLDIALIGDTDAHGPNAPDEKRDKVALDYGVQFHWQRKLWKAVAEANYCWHWIRQVYQYTGNLDVFDTKLRSDRVLKKIMLRGAYTMRVHRQSILGRETNVIATRVMGEYLLEVIANQCPILYGRRERNSWREGFVDRIVLRIEQGKEKEERKAKKVKARAGAKSTALTLLDVKQREHIANYEALHGKGSWAERLRQEAEWNQEQARRVTARAKEEARKLREWKAYLKTETEEQRAERLKNDAQEERRQERARERRSRGWYSRGPAQTREDKFDWSAYNAGNAKAETVSLSRQAGSGKERQRIGA